MTNPEASTTRGLLAQIPNLAERARPALTALSRPDTTSAPGPAGSRPPINLHALDLLQGRELHHWVMLAYDTMADLQQKQPWPDEDNITHHTAWLAKHAEWIIEQFPDPEPIAWNILSCPLYCDDGHYLTHTRIGTKDGQLVCRWCPTGFATAIRQLFWSYKWAVGETGGPKIHCPICGNKALIEGEWMVCTEVDGHARTTKDIEHEHRFQPAEPTKAIAQRFGIPAHSLDNWRRFGKNGRKLIPARKEGKELYWWPWDVFCLLNPSLAEAFAARDDTRTTAG